MPRVKWHRPTSVCHSDGENSLPAYGGARSMRNVAETVVNVMQ
jgi:hypothetical protein